MEDIIKLHDKKFRIMIPATKIDEAVAASRAPTAPARYEGKNTVS